MKSGHKLLLFSVILVLLYVPIVNAFHILDAIKRYKHKIELTNQGTSVGGPNSKLVLTLKDFELNDWEGKDKMAMQLWHERDSLFVVINGVDEKPEKRKTLSRSYDDSINEVSLDDKIKLSFDFNHDKTNHTNFQYSFSGAALTALNEQGFFVKGSRRPCPHPFHWNINGANWSFSTTIPLSGSKIIGFNVARKFYGGRDYAWWPGNNPKQFMTLQLK